MSISRCWFLLVCCCFWGGGGILIFRSADVIYVIIFASDCYWNSRGNLAKPIRIWRLEKWHCTIGLRSRLICMWITAAGERSVDSESLEGLSRASQDRARCREPTTRCCKPWNCPPPLWLPPPLPPFNQLPAWCSSSPQLDHDGLRWGKWDETFTLPFSQSLVFPEKGTAALNIMSVFCGCMVVVFPFLFSSFFSLFSSFFSSSPPPPPPPPPLFFPLFFFPPPLFSSFLFFLLFLIFLCGLLWLFLSTISRKNRNKSACITDIHGLQEGTPESPFWPGSGCRLAG